MTKIDEFERRACEGARIVAQAYLSEAEVAGQVLGRTFASEVEGFQKPEREHYASSVPEMLMALVQSVPVSHQPNRTSDTASTFYNSARQAFCDQVRSRAGD